MDKEYEDKSFTDIFAGTGVVAAVASKHFDEIILNDFLYSNYAIYKAFFDKGDWSPEKINSIIKSYNNINGEDLDDNYFSVILVKNTFQRIPQKLSDLFEKTLRKIRKNLQHTYLIASLLCR